MKKLFDRNAVPASALGGIALAAVVLGSSAAHATVTATLLKNFVTTNATSFFGGVPSGNVSAVIDTSIGASDAGIGATYVGTSKIDQNSITFKNAVISQAINSTFTTGVAVTFTNDQTFAYHPVIESTLLAAGFGVAGISSFIATSPNVPTRCQPTQLKNCGAVDQAAWIATGQGNLQPSTSGFMFDVSVGGKSIYNLSASLAGSVGPTGTFTENFNGADMLLSNFHRTLDSTYGRAYAWDDTHVEIVLPDLLQPGQSVTADFTNTTMVDSATNGIATGNYFGPNFYSIAFASFGDPTGGKRGVNPNVTRNGPLLGSGLANVDTNSFGTFALPVETVDPIKQTVVAELPGVSTQVQSSPHPYGVPEPAAFSLFGLGLVAMLVRRRQA